MSRLSNFLSQPLIINHNGMEFRVHPIAPKYDAYVRQLYEKDESKSNEAFFQVIKASLKDEAEITKAETDAMLLQERNLFIDAILEVNGYNRRIESVQNRIIAQQG